MVKLNKRSLVKAVDTYNSINQPQQVKSGSTVKHKFAYLADGRKLLSLDKIKSNDNIDKDGGLAYIGSSVFIINEGKYDGLESTSFSAGRIVRSGSSFAVQYHITDHLGSVRVVLDQNMAILEQNDYYPFGLRHPNASLKTTANRYRYNGKEEITSTNTSDYDARQYSAEFCQWLQVDPLAEKFYSTSAYGFCAGNPLKFADPDGRSVKPAGTAELIMIQNTLPKDARNYVRLDKGGFIDRDLLNSYNSKSLNYNNLKTMVNSEKMVEVMLDDKFTFIGQDGELGVATMPYNNFDPRYDSESDKDFKGETMNGTSTGESGFMGKTLFPDRKGLQNSPNENVIVIINKNLSPAAAAEIYSHEANGHALLYIMNGGNHNGASHQPVDERFVEGNITLKNMIINSKMETIKNMQR